MPELIGTLDAEEPRPPAAPERPVALQQPVLAHQPLHPLGRRDDPLGARNRGLAVRPEAKGGLEAHSGGGRIHLLRVSYAKGGD